MGPHRASHRIPTSLLVQSRRRLTEVFSFRNPRAVVSCVRGALDENPRGVGPDSCERCIVRVWLLGAGCLMVRLTAIRAASSRPLTWPAPNSWARRVLAVRSAPGPRTKPMDPRMCAISDPDYIPTEHVHAPCRLPAARSSLVFAFPAHASCLPDPPLLLRC